MRKKNNRNNNNLILENVIDSNNYIYHYNYRSVDNIELDKDCAVKILVFKILASNMNINIENI